MKTLLTVPLLALSASLAPLPAQDGPQVDIWLDNGGTLDRGQETRVHYTAEPRSYVVVARLDVDGHLTVLRPLVPGNRSFVSTSDERSVAFLADRSGGIGHVFAVASRSPFNFKKYRTADNRWNTWNDTLDEDGDPPHVIGRFAKHVAGGHPYSVAVADYEVTDRRASGAEDTHQPPIVLYNDGGNYDESYYPGLYGTPYLYPYDPYLLTPLDGVPIIVPGFHHHRHRARSNPHSVPGTGLLQRCPDGTVIPWNALCPSPGRGPGTRPPRHFPRAPTPPRLMPSPRRVAPRGTAPLQLLPGVPNQRGVLPPALHQQLPLLPPSPAGGIGTAVPRPVSPPPSLPVPAPLSSPSSPPALPAPPHIAPARTPQVPPPPAHDQRTPASRK